MDGWDIALSIITAFAAIIALVISVTQILISNRQFLFERRLKIVILIENLMSLYKSTSSTIEMSNRDEPAFANDLIFMWLTNNSYLQDMVNALKEPLENSEAHRTLLAKPEELRKAARECKIVFSKKKLTMLSEFIEQYVNLLFSIYQYRICLHSIEKNESSRQVKGDKLEESVRRKYYESYDTLKSIYKILIDDNTLNKAKRHIKI